jgi:hypothetical protein
MERAQKEIAAIEQTLADVEEAQVRELSDLQLALVGGGGGGETILH